MSLDKKFEVRTPKRLIIPANGNPNQGIVLHQAYDVGLGFYYTAPLNSPISNIPKRKYKF
ncbi:hypothetical protein HY212_04560 [Candidatus Pacearchaeota archaeon]|nr:hypothetical protein [Candidatus Pacearchaeota archaeon]